MFPPSSLCTHWDTSLVTCLCRSDALSLQPPHPPPTTSSHTGVTGVNGGDKDPGIPEEGEDRSLWVSAQIVPGVMQSTQIIIQSPPSVKQTLFYSYFKDKETEIQRG